MVDPYANGNPATNNGRRGCSFVDPSSNEPPEAGTPTIGADTPTTERNETMNRVIAAIEKAKARIQSRLAEGLVTPERVQELDRGLDMEAGEFCRFQELKSHAMLEGRLTQDEAQTIYGLLGNTPEHFNRQSVEAKSVLTQIFAELLKRRVR